jgi:hypothetical protein
MKRLSLRSHYFHLNSTGFLKNLHKEKQRNYKFSKLTFENNNTF